jgi:Leucine-rich repeat (LRR) protein
MPSSKARHSTFFQRLFPIDCHLLKMNSLVSYGGLFVQLSLVLLAVMFRWGVACSNFSAVELNALHDLYSSTQGWNWIWQPISYGAIWNFSIPNGNPCAQNWQGINCTSTCHVQSIELANYNLDGTLPYSLGVLNSMKIFGVDNNFIHGPLPTSLSNWTELVYFDVQTNTISGPFPAYMGTSWTLLRTLDIAYNQMTGELPNDINNVDLIEEISIRNNKMTGTIPNSITQLQTLKYLYCKYNQFTGTIPHDIGNMEKMPKS